MFDMEVNVKFSSLLFITMLYLNEYSIVISTYEQY